MKEFQSSPFGDHFGVINILPKFRGLLLPSKFRWDKKERKLKSRVIQVVLPWLIWSKYILYYKVVPTYSANVITAGILSCLQRKPLAKMHPLLLELLEVAISILFLNVFYSGKYFSAVIDLKF